MSIESTAAEECYGYIQLMHFCKVGAREEVVRLGGAGFLTQTELADAWAAVPEADQETDFMADLMDKNGDIVGDKRVSGAMCAVLLNADLGELIANGVAEVVIDRAAFMARLKGR